MYRNYSRPDARAIIYAPQTNMLVVYGSAYKVERNRRRIGQIFRYNALPMTSGIKFQETMSDPLHRKPEEIIRRARLEASVAGRSRGFIRPAAPGQVTWKYPYWNVQKNVKPIGPYNQAVKQSILQRISTTLASIGAGG